MSFLYCFSVVCFFINNEKSNYAASIVSFSRISEVLTALKGERYVFTDVQLRGYYPSYVLNEWERREFNIKMQAGDEQILREGVCDYLGFSYYMTNAVKADGGTGDALSLFYILCLLGGMLNGTVSYGWPSNPIISCMI